MTNKRVLVLSNMYPGEASQTFGIFVKNQVEALRQKGLIVDVVAIQDPRMGKKYALKKYIKWFFRGLLQLITKGRSYEVVHVHYVFPTGLLGLLFKKFFGCRLIVTSHGGDIERMASINRRIFKLTLKILHTADAVITVGDALKTQIIDQFKLDDSKITVLNMGVNRDVFKAIPKTDAQRKLKLDSQKQHILFVGNIIKAKGIKELIEGFELYQTTTTECLPAVLSIIGHPKEPDYYQEIVDMIETKGLKNVTIHPSKTQQDIAIWMSASDVFVLPSYMEGFGLVALEAMSCHTPVIGTHVGGLNDLLADGCGVLIEPQSSTAIAEAFKSVLNDEQLVNSLISHGERRAQENDQQILLNRLINLYFQKGDNIEEKS